VATTILRWLQAVAIETAFIDPGKPWQNGTDDLSSFSHSSEVDAHL